VRPDLVVSRGIGIAAAPSIRLPVTAVAGSIRVYGRHGQWRKGEAEGEAQLGELAGFKDPSIDLGNGFGGRTGRGGCRSGCGCGR